MKADLIPLFSSPLLIIDGVSPFDIDATCDAHEYVVANEGSGLVCEISVDRHILRKFPRDERQIFDLFDEYKRNVMKCQDVEFKLTTSWLTRTRLGGASGLHIHRNSVFTGVAFMSGCEGGAKLMLDWSLHAPGSFYFGAPTEWNIYNSNGWSVEPKEGRVVFFPSHVPHRIGPHNSEVARHTLAFNLFPVGRMGTDFDDAMTITGVE